MYEDYDEECCRYRDGGHRPGAYCTCGRTYQDHVYETCPGWEGTRNFECVQCNPDLPDAEGCEADEVGRLHETARLEFSRR